MRMKLLVLLIFAAGALVSLQPCVGQGKPAKWHTRQQFTESMAKITEGMSEAEVRDALGTPDDTRTQKNDNGMEAYGVSAVWGYGTDGHLTLPTLGEVVFDKSDKVKSVYGGTGQPPVPSLFTEDDLRLLLRVLNQTFDGASYDPRRFIRVVNTLQPLGKEKALAAITEYLRITPHLFEFDCPSARTGMFLVLRALFEVPKNPGYFFEPALGAPSRRPPTDRTKMPRWPLLLQDDIPLVLSVGGYTLSGVPEDPEMEIDDFRKNDQFRAKLLTPPSNPAGVVTALIDANPYYGLTELFSQMLWMVSDVYPVPTDKNGGKLSDAPLGQLYGALDAVSKLSLRWDAAKNTYVFRGENSQLSGMAWKPTSSEVELTVTLDRADKHSVSLSCLWQRKKALVKIKSGVLSIFNTKDRTSPLVQIPVTDQENAVTSIQSFTLEVGQQVVIEYKAGKIDLRSPVYTP